MVDRVDARRPSSRILPETAEAGGAPERTSLPARALNALKALVGGGSRESAVVTAAQAHAGSDSAADVGRLCESVAMSPSPLSEERRRIYQAPAVDQGYDVTAHSPATGLEFRPEPSLWLEIAQKGHVALRAELPVEKKFANNEYESNERREGVDSLEVQLSPRGVEVKVQDAWFRGAVAPDGKFSVRGEHRSGEVGSARSESIDLVGRLTSRGIHVESFTRRITDQEAGALGETTTLRGTGGVDVPYTPPPGPDQG